MEEKTLATSKQNYWLAVLLAWGIPELFGFYLYFIVDEFPEDEVIRYGMILGPLACGLLVLFMLAKVELAITDKRVYLFCDEYGRMLTENALRLAITHYNHSRGVEKTSIHLFRHTFARKYLVDCGGNAFTLQKLLGHATLKMTKHYCNIYDADIAKSFDRFSPLAQMNVNAERIAKLSARR